MNKTNGSGNSRIFDAIREDDFERVESLIEAEPSLVNAIAPKRPLDTRFMSPLQVALSTGWHKRIAWYLLEKGADVNYIPDKNLVEEARTVLFDAVNIAVWNARRYAWDGKSENPLKLVWKHTAEESDEAFDFLRNVVRRGADINKTDHYGRNVLMEAVGEAANLCPVMNTETGEYYPGRPITPEMTQDLRRIFSFLIENGADMNNISSFSKKSIREHYEKEPVWQICGIFWDGK